MKDNGYGWTTLHCNGPQSLIITNQLCIRSYKLSSTSKDDGILQTRDIHLRPYLRVGDVLIFTSAEPPTVSFGGILPHSGISITQINCKTWYTRTGVT